MTGKEKLIRAIGSDWDILRDDDVFKYIIKGLSASGQAYLCPPRLGLSEGMCGTDECSECSECWKQALEKEYEDT